ncbi:adenosine 3'-phospho 5'-phosphosulfate transporter 2-like isoform X2 [Dysidea avara]|uniref:adenosine 3'-phospho 5'-phosphosulfate transporter 2-like isoform X2 n=1 Tax=Dysidea avara TaxID=196820 RepID=UPI00331E8717
MQFSQRQGMSRLSSSPIHDRLTEVISESTGQASQAPQPEIISRSREVNDLYVLGIPLHKTSPLFQLVFSVTGVMVFYLLYGYVQEWIFHIDGFKPYGWYLTLVQFGCYSIFGVSEMLLTGAFGNRLIPLHVYGFIAFLTVATIGLSNTSLGYLNYPTQVIFKSCKLIPVMLGGVVIQGKRYGLMDVIAILCMTAGLVFFTLADSNLQPDFTYTGIILISMALCADAVIGNVQEKTLKQFAASNSEMVFYSYTIGFLYILWGLLLTNGLVPAAQFSTIICVVWIDCISGCGTQRVQQELRAHQQLDEEKIVLL